ncbi:TIGR03557 family F420-dependent LLM class oxidoreductase [Aquipuribacter nitratireducens]|uniref:TIGR03557 family F420-dependent LLM class oxidoreductase n=1 Tax=Aquipuribacter nitratireducens TaxID=650104 RepID=A0ABW0GPI0_9MICO
MQVGYKLATEGHDPKEIVELGVHAEQAGFDFVELSDHYHPWLEEQGHSGFTWTMLGTLAARTERIGLATGVTCPIIRYHPAVVAQAAATTALLSDGRFTLGIGAGERLNEHVVGGGWPSVGVRHRMLVEALEIIHRLFEGGYQSYDGQYLTLEDARVFDLPETPVPIAVAAGGPQAARLAADKGDGLFVTEPEASLLETFREAGGTGPAYAEVPLAYGASEEAAAEEAHRTSRWTLSGWKVMAELPNPVNFDAASGTVTLDDVRGQFSCGPDLDAHVEQARPYVEAGYDRLVLMDVGPDAHGFLDVAGEQLVDRVRALGRS